MQETRRISSTPRAASYVILATGVSFWLGSLRRPTIPAHLLNDAIVLKDLIDEPTFHELRALVRTLGAEGYALNTNDLKAYTTEHEHIGEAYGRVRMGIGHPGHKDAVAAYVLHDFAKADQAWLDDLLRGISDGAVLLAGGDGPKFLNAVALRMAPARPSTGAGKAGAGPTPPAAAPKPDPTATPTATPAPAPEDLPRTALQRLADRFRQG